MAQQVIVSLVDDIDGTDAAETIEFGLDGVKYEIELSQENANNLRDALAPYVEHGRRDGGRKRTVVPRSPASPPPLADKEQNQAIRAWARKQGFDVSDRGRIRKEIVEAYHQK